MNEIDEHHQAKHKIATWWDRCVADALHFVGELVFQLFR